MGSAHSNHERDETERVLVAARPNYQRCDNTVITAKFTVFTFLPLAIREQFRRFANVYFLVIGVIMFIGEYTRYYPSAYSYVTTLGPLAIVVSASLMVEGSADLKRHRSDEETNNAECTILRRSDEMVKDYSAKREQSIIGGKDILVNLSKQKSISLSTQSLSSSQSAADRVPDLAKVSFQNIKRMNIRQGHIVIVRNREEVPADLVILATSGENGCAYIETSSIDGETNLKLRNTPTMPSNITRTEDEGDIEENRKSLLQEDDDEMKIFQSLERAAKNITRFTALGYPDGVSTVENTRVPGSPMRRGGSKQFHHHFTERSDRSFNSSKRDQNDDKQFVATLVSEVPNPHINTFSGKLVLPPLEKDADFVDVPLNPENILLRGAVLRNTEWVIGLACFTGKDTKLVRNSSQTPSKFSRIDVLINRYVLLIIAFMCICIGYLSVQRLFVSKERFDELWYVGLGNNSTINWPYLPDDLPPPEWSDSTMNLLQNFLMFTTLLSNFVPLSMYITLELVNVFCLWLVNVDPEMYDEKSDTPALSRSTNVTDLGQIQYVFSDKTGTLTQNVMRFKRCSVDGMVFGAPVAKMRPNDEGEGDNAAPVFHPARQLVVGKLDYSADNDRVNASKGMTFNAEMFVRVMSLCHTVVVEKDLDNSKNIDESKSVSSTGSNWMFSGRTRRRKARKKYGGENADRYSTNALETVSEEPSEHLDMSDKGTSRSSLASMTRNGGGDTSVVNPLEKGRDGAPIGFAYQAESPDENALVSQASKVFGFQVVGRNSTGIVLRCDHPTVFSDEDVVTGLRNGTVSPKSLVSNFATGRVQVEKSEEERLKFTKNKRTETWEILAVNKFDSQRKRMSILLRSPPELGGVVVLFCKGADSAMLDPDVCSGSENLVSENAGFHTNKLNQTGKMVNKDEDSEWDTDQLLGIQSHLGEFASEGLRTLVLGIRFLTDAESDEWLSTYQTASSSLKNRDRKLRDAAVAIEKNLHIVGVTAVEDKLQTGVPETIATLSQAGIKLWVLTGDKRETAIEIGYSTKVLTSNMHLTQVADQGADYVRAQCAMEFMHLVKAGKLPLYQNAAIDQLAHARPWANAIFQVRKVFRFFSQMWRYYMLSLVIWLRKSFGMSRGTQEKSMRNLVEEQKDEKERLENNMRRRNVRNLAERTIKKFRAKYPQHFDHDRIEFSPSSSLDLANDELPPVFDRAENARSALESRSSKIGLTSSNLRNLRLTQLTAQEIADNEGENVKDEDILSLKSVYLGTSDLNSIFDPKKRTVLERLFSVDRDVRKGRLLKHKKKDANIMDSPTSATVEGSRALIVEGEALKHILGDGEMEELLFNVASQCDAVIACRVSPQQKALLVKLVRHNVVPEPVTLAIGDGANDVGMIQEAHVGIGISGKEGRQAVNASDFAIAQFRFLETLILIHGRWDFMRQATVVLFSFYKNAVMAGCLIAYNGMTLYSGQSIFDQWTVSAFNFLVSFPISFLGFFDRCLEKDYIRRNPEVYKATRNNEVLTIRILCRWIFITISHVLILYFGTFFYLAGGSGNTSAFTGLMKYQTRVGDGEAGGISHIGLIIYSSLVILLVYKVLYESRTIIYGNWPPCWHARKDGFWSNVPYSWYGVTIGSLYFHFFFFLPIYNYISKNTERKDSSGFFNFNGIVPHVFSTSSVTYIALGFIPIAAMAFDVCWKVFSNMYYPTQTQIHIEIESKEFAEKRLSVRDDNRNKKRYWQADT